MFKEKSIFICVAILFFLLTIYKDTSSASYRSYSASDFEEALTIVEAENQDMEDLKCLLLQQKDMSKSGGEEYDNLLKEEVKRIKSETKGDDIKIEVPGPSDIYNKKLADIFGPLQDDDEIGLIRASFWIHAVFEFFDEKFGKNAEKQKIEFIKACNAM